MFRSRISKHKLREFSARHKVLPPPPRVVLEERDCTIVEYYGGEEANYKNENPEDSL
jgi:hypothetical protein